MRQLVILMVYLFIHQFDVDEMGVSCIANAPWIGDFDDIFVLSDDAADLLQLRGFQMFSARSFAPMMSRALSPPSDLSLTSVVFISYQNDTTVVEAIEAVALQWWSYMCFVLLPDSVDINQYLKLLHNPGIVPPLDSDLYFVTHPDNFTGGYELWEFYELKELQILQRVECNLSDPDFIMQLVGSKWKRRGDFQGISVIATAVIDPDYEDEVTLITDDDGNLKLESGYAVEIYRNFRELLNFTEAVIEGDYMLGKEHPNAPGMEMLLLNGTADISITESVVGEEKAEVVQMLHASMYDWVEVQFSRQPPSPTRFFLQPFTTTVWALVALHLIVATAFFRFFHQAIWKLRRILTEDSSALMAALWALGSLCLTNCCERPTFRPLRVLFLVVFVVGYLLNICYVAVMTAQLSVRQKSSATLETLLYARYEFYVEEDVHFPIDLEDFPQWQGVRVHGIESEDALIAIGRDVINYQTALVAFPEYFHVAMKLNNYSHRDACDLFDSIRVSHRPTLCSMWVGKSSPFKEIFNVKTLLLASHGILTRLRRKYKRQSILQYQDQNYNLVPQSLQELSLSFAILVVGTCASIALLVAEKLAMRTIRSNVYLRKMSMMTSF